MLSAGKFATDFVPAWIDLALDRQFGGVVQRLDSEGRRIDGEKKTVLVQARTIFSLAHLYLQNGNPTLLQAALSINSFMLAHLRTSQGGYRFAVETDGRSSGEAQDNLCRAYDQSFVLLALVTLQKADPGAVGADAIAELWQFIEALTEPNSGALYEDDQMAQQGSRPGDQRSQNPQMHMLEAVLQAYELSGNPVWLDRADRYVTLAKDCLIDPTTGAVREFVSYDLSPLASVQGLRREPGHQYEWAWLLLRYRDLGGRLEVTASAQRMASFADRYGIRRDGGPLSGAPYDALDGDGQVVEASHLLWPVTELGKLACSHHLQGVDGAAEQVARVEQLIFQWFFASGRITWVNQLDGSGKVVVSDALSRLIYHVLLFVTEGARAGFWSLGHDHSH